MNENLNKHRLKYRYLKRRKLLTCIIGAKCAEGTAIISDTRVMRQYEANNESKIHLIWEPNPKVVVAGAGTTALIDKFAEAIGKSKIPSTLDFTKVVETIEDIVFNLRERYEPRIQEDYDFQALIMGFQDFDKGDPYLRLVHGDGISEDVKDYAIIGHGAPYVTSLFRLLYDNMLTVSELAVLGYFAVSTIVFLGLDQTVGITQLGPESVVLKSNEKPCFLNPLDHEFLTTRQSLSSLRFRFKLVKSIWSKIPQAYENLDPSLF